MVSENNTGLLAMGIESGETCKLSSFDEVIPLEAVNKIVFKPNLN